jgi:uncharacterized protein
MRWFGIDYGSKIAGTTAVAFLQNEELVIVQSKKNQDADSMIKELVDVHKPKRLFIDVPLSLPGVYKEPDLYSDYFYRACDRNLRAMSPMFLAGLTARGMKLSADFAKTGIISFETYPSALSKLLEIEEWEQIHQTVEKNLHPIKVQKPSNKHQADALLCFFAGFRFENGQSKIVGDESEGLIYL